MHKHIFSLSIMNHLNNYRKLQPFTKIVESQKKLTYRICEGVILLISRYRSTLIHDEYKEHGPLFVLSR